VPLARHVADDDGMVVGVDLLEAAVDAARANVAAAGLDNVQLHQADLLEFLREQPDETFAGALWFEVGYQVLDLPAHIAELHRVLRPGCFLLASFRTQHYLALFGARERDWMLTETVVRQRSAHLPGMGWQNWHTAADAVAQLENAGFSEVALSGVGLCSGIMGDPFAAIARPSELSSADLRGLAFIEEQLAQSHPDVGRYLLTAAVRA